MFGHISMADSVDMIEVACLRVAQYGVLLQFYVILLAVMPGNAFARSASLTPLAQQVDSPKGGLILHSDWHAHR